MTQAIRRLPGWLLTGILSTVGLLVVFGVTQVIPSATSNSRGTPYAVLFLGVIYGMLNALTAAAVVLVYRTTRVFNFAQTAIGAGGGLLCFNLIQLTGVPFWAAFPIGVIVAAALGAVFDLIFGRRFFNAPRLVLTVLTIVAAGFLASAGTSAVNHLPIFPDPALRTLEQLAGTSSLRPLLPFPGFKFTFPDLPIPYGFVEIFAIAASLTAILAVGAFLRFTRAGVAVRAMAENKERAALLGISVGALSTMVWTLAGFLSGVSMTIAGLLGTPAQASGFAPTLLLPGLVAAVIARMRSIPVAIVAAVGIGLMERSIAYLQADLSPLVSVGELIIVAAALLLQSRRGTRSEEGVTSSWAATEEVRPIPREMSRLNSVRITRWVLALVFVAAIVIYPFISGTGQLFLGAVIALNAIVGLSLVVLTGWSGQVSLGQFGYFAIGAYAAAILGGKLGISFWITVPAAAAITGAVAILTGLPALRIPGLFLGVATFVFAIAVRDVLFAPRFLGQFLPAQGLDRPQLFVVDFQDEKSMYFLCVVALVLCMIAVINLRRSRFGRVVIAVRDNDTNAESAGIPVIRTKLTAFAIAGLLAGFAGALFAFQQRGVSADSFNPAASINAFVQVVIGGVSSVWGPILGSLYINGSTFALNDLPEVAAFLGPLLGLILLYAYPGGIMSIIAKIRDAALRIIAQRNQILVPSLFADMDPEALRQRLVPVASPVGGGGLERITRRYRIKDSRLARLRPADERSAEASAMADVEAKTRNEEGLKTAAEAMA